MMCSLRKIFLVPCGWKWICDERKHDFALLLPREGAGGARLK